MRVMGEFQVEVWRWRRGTTGRGSIPARRQRPAPRHPLNVRAFAACQFPTDFASEFHAAKNFPHGNRETVLLQEGHAGATALTLIPPRGEGLRRQYARKAASCRNTNTRRQKFDGGSCCLAWWGYMKGGSIPGRVAPRRKGVGPGSRTTRKLEIGTRLWGSRPRR